MKTVLYAQCQAQDPDHHGYHAWRTYFKEAGWTVIDFDYTIEEHRLGVDGMRRLFRLLLENEKPDLVWHGLYMLEFTREDLDRAKCPVIGWCSDDGWRLNHSIDFAPGHDAMITAIPSAVAQYEKAGHKAVWVPWCVNESQYPRVSDDGEGVVFVGQKLPYRERFLGELWKRGLKLGVYGLGWGDSPGLKWGTMVSKIHKAAVVLGMCEATLGGLQVKARHVEVPALGRVHVINDDPDVSAVYGPTLTAATYRDANECVDVVRRLQADAELRRGIEDDAYGVVTERYTWDRWLGPVIEEVMG